MNIANVIINITTPYIRTSLLQLPDSPDRERSLTALRTLTETLSEYEQIIADLMNARNIEEPQ